MFRRKKPVTNPVFSEKLSTRVSKIATADLVLWIDQAMSETNRCISAYQRSGEKHNLEDMLIGAEAIHALVSELHTRTMI